MISSATGLAIGLASELTSRLLVEILLYVGVELLSSPASLSFSPLVTDQSNVTALRLRRCALFNLLLAVTIAGDVALRLAGFLVRSSFDATRPRQ